MDEDDAIGLTLLVIDRRHPETQIHADGSQDNGQRGKPSDQPAGERVKASRCCKLENRHIRTVLRGG